ncbi:acyl carrier protein [Roseicyclus mahoneyensis]|uniref:Acyl carrier protein n=1 Tax=Roseicyclus mahoneyensis TaxID=164332 RepID=A0A316GK23_9RHOB|nr:acyl carrier protein [Roseicyclus mahoneyensis]PWK61141.1 acyl carrier protein [Roseicyclus mahoneyensis]
MDTGFDQPDRVLHGILGWIMDKTGSSPEDIQPDTALLDIQLLDSLQLMDLVFFLEKTHGTSIPLEWLTPENFATPRAIGDMIKKACA